jgi:hypothetical protein
LISISCTALSPIGVALITGRILDRWLSPFHECIDEPTSTSIGFTLYH